MANVFFFAAGLTNTSPFVNSSISFPFEDGERTETDPAFLAIILLEHSHVGILAIAFFTGNREIRFFPPLPVDTRTNGHIPLAALHSLLINFIKQNEKL